MAGDLTLAQLASLERITKAIKASGENLTATRLKRSLSISDADFAAIEEYGRSRKILKRLPQNYYGAYYEYQISEESYYPVVEDAIKALWLNEGFPESSFYLENTSRKDSKIQGRWTRPDFTLVSYKKFPWTIGEEFDIVTFEVKRPDQANVLAVFEALAHASAATRAYVVFPLSYSDWLNSNQEQARRVEDECARHGVGLIMLENPSEQPVCLHRLKATRRQIDHERCSAFLGAVLSEAGKQSISAWK